MTPPCRSSDWKMDEQRFFSIIPRELPCEFYLEILKEFWWKTTECERLTREMYENIQTIIDEAIGTTK